MKYEFRDKAEFFLVKMVFIRIFVLPLHPVFSKARLRNVVVVQIVYNKIDTAINYEIDARETVEV